MITRHFSDEELQLYANNPGINETAANHLIECDQCRAALNNYQLLFEKLNEQQPPLFKFNLAGMVMPQVNGVKPKHKKEHNLIVSLSLFVLLFSIFLCYLFKTFLPDLFQGMGAVSGYLSIAVIFAILCLLGFEQYRNYERKMRTLDYY